MRQLVDEVARRGGVPRKVVDEVVRTLFSEIVAGMLVKPVMVQGFRKFEAVTRAGKRGFDPVRRERIVVPERRRARFTPGAALKAALLGPKA